VANDFRRKRGIRDGVVFVGVAQEKAQVFQGKKIDGQFLFTHDKTVYVNHYYFYIDDADSGPLFLKVCSYAPWPTKRSSNGHGWAKRQLEKKGPRKVGTNILFGPTSQAASMWWMRNESPAIHSAVNGARTRARLTLLVTWAPTSVRCQCRPMGRVAPPRKTLPRRRRALRNSRYWALTHLNHTTHLVGTPPYCTMEGEVCLRRAAYPPVLTALPP